nr:DUF3450 domain-containing protein [uncultured Desulfobulbus sp.]
MVFTRFFLSSLLCLGLFAAIAQAQTQTQQRVEKPLRQAVDTRQAAQKTLDTWQTDRERLTAQYELLQEEIQQLQERQDELQSSVDATQERLAAKKHQLEEIARITGEISPFLDQLLQQLSLVAGSGPPFLQQERTERLEKLQGMINDPSVTVGEKYRRLMEGLLVEAEYGISTEVYQDHIDLDGQSILVDIFRLGRLNLFYLTLDQSSCGFYNEAAQAWQPLDPKELRPLKAAVAMAAKRQPVELVSLPIGRMVQP